MAQRKTLLEAGQKLQKSRACALAWPASGKVTIKALKAGSDLYQGEISKIELLGCDTELAFSRTKSGLDIVLPAQKPNEILPVFKIYGK